MPDLHRGLGPAREGGTIVGFLFARWPRVRVATAGLASTILVGSLLLGGAASVAAKDHESNRPGSVDIQLLSINDFHGQLPDYSTTLGGIRYLGSYVRTLEAQNPNTLFLSAGDLIGASPLVSALFHDCLLYTSDAADDLLCVDLGG